MKYFIAVLFFTASTAYAATMGHVSATVISSVTAEQAAAGKSAPCIAGDEMMICFDGVR